MNKRKLVEVTLKLPKPIIDLLKDVGENVEEYLVQSIIGVVEADLEADAFWNPKRLAEKHNLMPIFKSCNILVSSYVNPEA